jgi:hypothetical protein
MTIGQNEQPIEHGESGREARWRKAKAPLKMTAISDSSSGYIGRKIKAPPLQINKSSPLTAHACRENKRLSNRAAPR